MDIDFCVDLLSRSLPLLLMGFAMTIQILILSATLSFSLGLIFGTLCCDEIHIPILSRPLQLITFILRAIPFYVQLLLVYFIVPDILGIELDALPASILALGLCSSGYVCQIVRAGINSIPLIQWETAAVLGYGRLSTLRCIILPQMLQNVLPAFNNELESILKSTSILSAIGTLELTRIGMNIVSRELKYPLTIYLIIATFYVAISSLLNFVAKYLEKRISRKLRHVE